MDWRNLYPQGWGKEMLKSKISAVIWGVCIWAAAISLFMLFGADLLPDPAEDRFFLLWLGLEAVTALLIYGAALLYTRFHPAPHAGLSFGVYGSTVGLLLDTFVIWKHNFFFPAFSQDQLLSFVIWMSFAYALFLSLPQWVDRRKQSRADVKSNRWA